MEIQSEKVVEIIFDIHTKVCGMEERDKQQARDIIELKKTTELHSGKISALATINDKDKAFMKGALKVIISISSFVAFVALLIGIYNAIK